MSTRTELERLLEQADSRCYSLVERINGLKQENLQLYNKWNAINEEKIQLKKTLEQADRSYDILLKENERLLLRADRLEAENKELKFENNKLQQWTLNDRKVRHGFELAIETLKKCKEV